MNLNQILACSSYSSLPTAQKHHSAQETSSDTAGYGEISSILQRSTGLHDIIDKAVREANGNIIIVPTSFVNERYDRMVDKESGYGEVHVGSANNDDVFLEMVKLRFCTPCIVTDAPKKIERLVSEDTPDTVCVSASSDRSPSSAVPPMKLIVFGPDGVPKGKKVTAYVWDV